MAIKLKLKLSKPFGPFTQMQEIDLPEFAVLTGLNGSGKTQLLRAIQDGYVETLVSNKQITPHSYSPLTGKPFRWTNDEHLTQWGSEILYVGPQLTPDLQLKYQRSTVDKQERTLLELWERFRQEPTRTPRDESTTERQLTQIAAIVGKPICDLLEQEVTAFAVSTIPEATTQQVSTNLAQVSMGYLRHYYHWSLARFLRQTGDCSLDSLVDIIGDVQSRPAPWKLVSQVLQPFGFRIEGPDISMASAQQDLSLKLMNHAGHEVSPDELSGGEQILLSLRLGSNPSRVILTTPYFSATYDQINMCQNI